MINATLLREVRNFRVGNFLTVRSEGQSSESGGHASAYVALELALIVAAIAVIGFQIVPAHWTTIWMDREFTGWVAPIAERMSHGLKLYGPGGHIPMPPLPFVLMQIVCGTHITWWSESFANFLLQSLMLLTVYLTLAKGFKRPMPFLATFLAIPLVFALPKTIMYDSLAQFLVALAALLALQVICGEPGRARMLTQRGTLLLLAAVTALCLLAKQSTGGGVYLGVFLALVLLRRDGWRGRLLGAVAYTAWTCFFLGVFALAMSSVIDIPGMIHDVFLAGSEPKGGPSRLVKNLMIYGLQISNHVLMIASTLFAAFWVIGWRPGRDKREATNQSAMEEPSTEVMTSTAAQICRPAFLWTIYAAALVAAPSLLLFQMQPFQLAFLVQEAGKLLDHLLWLGLLAALLWSVSQCLPRRWMLNIPPPPGGPALAVLSLVFFLAAVLHSMSGARFRWTYDNNPLILLALAVLLEVSWPILRRLEGRGLAGIAAVFTLMFFFQCVAWAGFVKQYAACRKCTEAWPEIAYLNGARLTPTAQSMRDLVTVVRQLAPDAERDAVLLLPSDPNVEMWFERPRPTLSCPIVFADQYWDRYVTADLEALEKRLPRVIVIGPKNYWRDFHRIWNKNYGAELLIDRLTTELIPAHYELHTAHPISHAGKPDIMEVYRRKH